MAQFSDPIDADLNALESILAKAIKKRDDAASEFDSTWQAIFATFDRGMGSKGEPARFVCNDGYTLARQVSNPEERLDDDALQAAIQTNYPPAVSHAIWTAITKPVTTRVVDQAKLKKVITAGRLDAAVAQKGIVKPKSVTSRNRPLSTKEDKELFGTGAREPIAIGKHKSA